MYTVYKHTNKFNNKVYIGITSQKTYQRWKGSKSIRFEYELYKTLGITRSTTQTWCL